MKRKLPQLFKANVRIYFLLLISFAVATFFVGGHGRILAVVQLGIIVLAAIYLQWSTRQRTNKLISYLESISDSMDLSVRDTPLPVLVHNSETGEIVWSNDRFAEIIGSDETYFDVNITDVLPEYSWDWLLEGKHETEDPIMIEDRFYRVYGNVVLSDKSYVAMTYWLDITDLTTISKAYLDSRLVFVLMTLDNYDELQKGMSAKEKSSILSDIDDKISTWISGKDGYLSRFDRDRYFFLFEERFLDGIIADRFSILEALQTCVGTNGVKATISIGLGKDGDCPYENYRYAGLALEMALSRGGNQAVLRKKDGFDFFGGRPQSVERRSKVRARVMANSFGELLAEASKVFVMGHKVADYDSIGASVGICCIARAKGKPVHIVIDLETSIANNIVYSLSARPEYANIFISPQDAVLQADSGTLLVIVDTSRPDKVESDSLYLSCTQIAVIDHHRRAADYIEDAVLSFHEPYASSASELVTEMMQYLVDSDQVLAEEAEAILAGIVLDTKGFAINTGSGTFDAAAYLKRAGADAAVVKRLLQTDITIATERYDLLRLTEIYKAGITMAISNKEHSRISIAQAADEMLGIKGANASFVIAKDKDTIYVSARSIGEVNVQAVLEKLGGGGSQSTAGLQVKDKTIDQVADDVKAAIDSFLKNYQTNRT